MKSKVLRKQNHFYKGINFSLIDEIYNALDDLPSDRVHLHANCELKNIQGSFELSFWHSELETSFIHPSNAVILATGYQNMIPEFLSPVKDLIQWQGDQYQVNRNYSIDRHNSLFVQNAELHTHGFNAADLGMGPYRNAVILNTVLGQEHFQLEQQVVFQSFGLPPVKEQYPGSQ
jgi:lysine N6-hydroxylase